MAFGRALLVGNRSAQSGRASESIDRAVSGLRARRCEVTLVATAPRGRTVEIVRAAMASEAPDVVVYLGGDGTFNEVARGILAAPAPVPMGMLPMGTANDQGRSFGVWPGAAAIERNLDIILAGHVTRLDAGRVAALGRDGRVLEERLFFDSAGWGVQPDILAKRNRDRATVAEIPILRDVYRDHAVYLGATIDRVLSSYVEPTKFNAVVTADGVVHSYERLMDLFVKGTAVYGGEWVPVRDSEPDDGRMELVAIEGRRDWAFKAFRDLATSPISPDELHALGLTASSGISAASFDISLYRSAREAVASQVDGEEWLAGNHFRVSVIPRALALLTPKNFVPPWKL